MDTLKLRQEYNHNLTRYYNGCKYCEEHRKEIDKWQPELLKIQDKINELLEEIIKQQELSDKEILEGFKNV